MKHLLTIALALPFLLGCRDKVQKAGRIQIEAVVYHDPNGDLYNSDLVQISDLYFVESRFLEHIPYYNDTLLIPRFTYIDAINGLVTKGNSLEELQKNQTYSDVSKKKYGALFKPPPVPNYDKREDISDTILEGYDYKRLRIVNDSSYSVFYVHRSDTVIPFSLAPQIDKDYKGVLNRIDTYDKLNDRFVSLRMTVTDTIPKSIYNLLNKKRNGHITIQ